jgi:hypothetical protein
VKGQANLSGVNIIPRGGLIILSLSKGLSISQCFVKFLGRIIIIIILALNQEFLKEIPLANPSGTALIPDA